jgi:hypothetical protein
MQVNITETLDADDRSCDKTLRSDLGKAIAAKQGAEEIAADAKATLTRADDAVRIAKSEVEKLESEAKRAHAHVSARDTASVVEALKAGSALPALGMPELDSTALAHAKVKLATLQDAREAIAAEYAGAMVEVSRAASNIRLIKCRIFEEDAEAIGAQMVVIMEQFWELENRFEGLLMIAPRKGEEGAKWSALATAIRQQCDRRARAIAKDQNFLEQSKWLAHRDAITERFKQKWIDYSRRLESDSNTTFEE